ncbi:hypothetical protein B0H11DRAFT_1912241 [Mycena galericulata]|nr:hypothetical protein B0H11DRAFT_1912241 [Mycena galericulata]
MLNCTLALRILVLALVVFFCVFSQATTRLLQCQKCCENHPGTSLQLLVEGIDNRFYTRPLPSFQPDCVAICAPRNNSQADDSGYTFCVIMSMLVYIITRSCIAFAGMCFWYCCLQLVRGFRWSAAHIYVFFFAPPSVIPPATRAHQVVGGGTRRKKSTFKGAVVRPYISNTNGLKMGDDDDFLYLYQCEEIFVNGSPDTLVQAARDMASNQNKKE